MVCLQQWECKKARQTLVVTAWGNISLFHHLINTFTKHQSDHWKKEKVEPKKLQKDSYSVPWNYKFQIFGSSLCKSSSLNISLPSSCTSQGKTKFLKWISIKEHIIFQVKERDSQNYLKGFTYLKRKLFFCILREYWYSLHTIQGHFLCIGSSNLLR